MIRPRLLAWQREGYSSFHQAPLNLLIHIVAVPGFVCSTIFLLGALAGLRPLQAAAALLGMALSFAAQAVGHGREENPAIPFDGPGDAVSRIFAEQFITFPRYLASGDFFRALSSKTKVS